MNCKVLKKALCEKVPVGNEIARAVIKITNDGVGVSNVDSEFKACKNSVFTTMLLVTCFL